MSFIIPFLTSPGSYALQAYKQACFKSPWQKQTGLRESKGDLDYNQTEESLSGNDIKTEMQPFLDKERIRKDLIIEEVPNLGFCSALGTNMFIKSDAAIVVSPGFYAADKEACSWLMKHEINHIKCNDAFIGPLVPAICSTAAAVFGTYSMSLLPATFLTISVGWVAEFLFSQWREGKADDFAIANSCGEELKGGRRWLMSIQETVLKERKTFWKKILISASGDVRSDLLHPSTTSRIQKIERALQRINVSIDDVEENPKMEQMKTFIRDKKSEVEEAAAEIGFFNLIKQKHSI